MRLALRLLLAAWLIAPLAAGNRVLQVPSRWALSSFEKTAIVRAGYDYAPAVMQDGSAYRMWWCGSAPTGNPYVDHIWTADSSDALNWTRFRVALPPSPLALVCDPSVVRVGTTYFMYFTGTNDGITGTNNQIYLAQSQDGEIWVKYPSDQEPQPIIALPGTISGYGIGQPSVLYLNGRFWLYYTDTTREGGGTFLDSSADGITFQKENNGHRILASNSVDVKYSLTLGLFLMVHGVGHDKLFFASSSDGIQWEAPSPGRYLALAPAKNKAFEGGLLGSATGLVGNWTYYYFASHQGTPGQIQDPLSWDIEAGRLSFSALPPSGTVLQYTSPVIASMDHLFDTQIATPLLYDYEQRAFAVETAQRTGLAAFYRLYHPTRQDHFYTLDPTERNFAISLGYRDEGILGYVSPVLQGGTLPLYRLYHTRGDHYYTVDPADRDRRKNSGYVDEGIAAYVWPADRSGQPPPPGVTVPVVFGEPQGVAVVDYDAGGVPGGYDIRLEISAANQGFQASNPSVADPLARVSQRIAGNTGTARIAIGGFPPGRYQVRVAALDEAGLGLGRYSDSRTFQIGAPTTIDGVPFGYIDIPAESFVTDGLLGIEGWALDDQGVTRVEVFLDGRSLGPAAVGRPRPDVRQVFPSYPNAETSGYRLEASISPLSSGTHLILVEVTDTAGQRTVLGPRAINLVNGGNLAPFGFLDGPPPGAVAGNSLQIAGWALDDRGVSRVELWVDGLFMGRATYGVQRPDVGLVFPGYPNNPLSGFSALLNTFGLTPGSHQLVIRIVDNQELSTDLPARAFTR